MKACLLLILILPCYAVRSQQSSIRGQVSIMNSETFTGKRQYLPNALVKGKYIETNSWFTDNLGQFELIFKELEDNKTVYLDIKKEPLKVVNTTALKAVTG